MTQYQPPLTLTPHMRAFYQAFPIWSALLTELSWTHYRTLPKLDSDSARQWYNVQANV